MDASNDVGREVTRAFVVCDLDLYGPELAFDVARIAVSQRGAFAKLVKAIAFGDLSLEDQIFRRWGIR